MFIQMQDREDRERRLALAKREQARPERGVYRDDLAPAGWRWFKIVTASGKVGIVHLPDELVDAAFTENLWRRLEARDPVLKIV